MEDLNSQSETDQSISLSTRAELLLTGAILPALCIAKVLLGEAIAIDSPWQSGRLQHYATVMLDWPAIGMLLPLVLFSASCLTMWVVAPRTTRFFLVRLGIYTGIPVATLFLVLIILMSRVLSPFIALFVGPGLYILCLLFAGMALRRMRRFSIRDLFILTFVCAVLAVVPNLRSTVEGALIFLLAATPTLTPIAYFRASVHVSMARVENRPPLARVIASWIGWLVGASLCFRESLQTTLAEYARLPTTNPNCYLSEAANHRAFRGRCDGTGRKALAVSLQTKRLKFLELVFALRCRRTHAWLRRLYDRIGPALAKRCRSNVWLASATYIALIPLEYLAECARYGLGISTDAVNSLYAADPPEKNR